MEKEKKLLELARNGDVEAFVSLLKDSENRLQKAAHILCPGEEEDLLQETYLCAFKGIKRFRGKSAFYTWIYRIMLNNAYKKYRKRERKKVLLGKLSKSSSGAVYQGREEIDFIHKEKVRRAVASLPLKYRETVMLYYFEEYSLRRISEELGIKQGTVKTRLFTARNLIKRKLM